MDREPAPLLPSSPATPPRDRHERRGVATTFWLEPHWKVLLRERAGMMGVSVSDYIRATLMYSLIQEMGMGLCVGLDGEPEIAGMSAARILEFHKRRMGFRVTADTGAALTTVAAPLSLRLDLANPPRTTAGPEPAGYSKHLKGGHRGD